MNIASALLRSRFKTAAFLCALPAFAFAQTQDQQPTTGTSSVATPASATTQAPVEPVAPTEMPWRIDTSLNYSRGDYGLADDTEVYVALLNAVYENKSWRFQVGVPVLHIEGPAAVVGGGAGVPVNPAGSSETGLGDVTVTGTYKFGELTPAKISTDFSAQVKLPTADEDKGLGTGEFDTYLQFDIRRSFGAVSPFATLGYRFLGTNSTYQLEDGLFATIGVAAPVGKAIVAGVATSWRERVVDGGDDSVDAMVFAQRTFSTHWRGLVYGLAGFTDAAPDFGFGIGATCKF